MAPQVDGLLLLSPRMADDDLRGLGAAVPLVTVNRQLAGVPAVLMTSGLATAHALEHLHALGHRRLVYLSGPENWFNAAPGPRLRPRPARGPACPETSSDPSSRPSPPASGPPTWSSRGRRRGCSPTTTTWRSAC